MPVPRVPVVSVLITAFQRQELVGRAIESVLASTFEDLEVVVVDDHSSDETAAEARKFERIDSRVRVFVNPSNLGDYRNRNRAASLATGTYLKYVDSDDMIYPHGLGVMVSCLEAFPEAGLGLSAAPSPEGPFPHMVTCRDAYLEHFFGRDLLARAPGSAIIRRSSFTAVGGFSGRRQVGDHELWLSLARKYPLVKMPRDLVWDRAHEGQEKWQDSEGARMIMHEGVMIDALRSDDCPLSPDEKAQALARLQSNRGRNYWVLFAQGGGIGAAEAYRRASNTGIGEVVEFAFRRAGRVLRPK